MTIIIRCIIEKDGKYYPDIYLDDALYEIISEGIDVNKSSNSKDCSICHYWYFIDKNFKYDPYLCNGCSDVIMKAISFKILSLFILKEMLTELCFLL